MKQGLVNAMICALTCCTSLSAFIIPFEQLTEDVTTAFFESDQTGYLVEFTKGTSIPTSFFVDGEVIKLQGTGEWTITVQRTFFMKHEESQFLFSFDQSKWVTLAEFMTGKMEAGISFEEGYPNFQMGMELNAR